MITEAELSAAAGACGVGVRTLTDQLARWKKSPWHEQTVRAAAREAGYNKVSLEKILGQVKLRNQAEKFTSEELHAAGAHIGASQAVAATIGELNANSFSAETVIAAAHIAGWKSRMQEVLAEACRLRKPVIANDDDVLTVRELRQWAEREMQGPGLRLGTCVNPDSIDKMMADIARHREPGYPEGTVVKDARDDWWFRTAFGKWESFGVSGSVAHDVPARPLKVMS